MHRKHPLPLWRTFWCLLRAQRAGHRIMAAHAHDGLPVILLDRRPAWIETYAYISDQCGVQYGVAMDHGVRIEWIERKLT